jgi:hypothetical protein
MEKNRGSHYGVVQQIGGKDKIRRVRVMDASRNDRLVGARMDPAPSLSCKQKHEWHSHPLAYHLTVPVCFAIARLVRETGEAPSGTKAVTPVANKKRAKKERKDLMVETVG